MEQGWRIWNSCLTPESCKKWLTTGKPGGKKQLSTEKSDLQPSPRTYDQSYQQKLSTWQPACIYDPCSLLGSRDHLFWRRPAKSREARFISWPCDSFSGSDSLDNCAPPQKKVVRLGVIHLTIPLLSNRNSGHGSQVKGLPENCFIITVVVWFS